MSYKELLLRSQEKNKITKLSAEWDIERQTLQQDIINLQNSTDIKLLEQAQQESKRLQKILDDTVNILGSSDIKNLTDLSNLLQGKTLKELAQHKSLLEQKIKDQDAALFNLAKQKIKGKKEAEKILTELETNFKEKEANWETEKVQQAQAIAQSREISKGLEKKVQEKKEEIKKLNENNDKLSKKVDELVLSKNQAQQEYQEQLKKINILFDENAKNYSEIDFNGLYSLLSKVAEREREQKRMMVEEIKKTDGSSPIFGRKRKEKK